MGRTLSIDNTFPLGNNSSMPEPKPNEGARLLREVAEKAGANQRIADELGINAAVVHRWLHCTQLPDAKRRAILEDTYHIPWRSWDEPPAEPETQGAA